MSSLEFHCELCNKRSGCFDYEGTDEGTFCYNCKGYNEGASCKNLSTDTSINGLCPECFAKTNHFDSPLRKPLALTKKKWEEEDTPDNDKDKRHKPSDGLYCPSGREEYGPLKFY